MTQLSATDSSTLFYRKPIFGLPIIVACFFGMSSNVGPLLYASFAFVIRDLESEFGWSRTDMTLSITLLTLVSAAVQPFFGQLVDRWGVRRTLIPSFLMMALILATLPIYLSAIWHLWLAFSMVAIFGAANNNLPFIRLISTWFDKRRGFMIGLIASGTGFGLAILPKVTEKIVSLYGWQGAFIFYGLFISCLSVPLMFLLIRDNPRTMGLSPDGVTAATALETDTNLSGLTLRDALHTQGFWLLFFGVLFASFALWGITNQMGLVLIDRGYSPAFAASVAVSLGLSMAASRLIIGYLLDKVFAPIVGGIVFMLTAVGFTLLVFVPSQWTPFIAASLLGMGLGAETELLGYMVSRYFGLRHFGTIYGIVFVGFLLGTSGGPYLYARTQQIFDSYDPALTFMIILMSVTALMFASMGKYDRYHHKFSSE